MPGADQPATPVQWSITAWEGPRGETWVLLQAGLALFYLFAPRPGGRWPAPLRRGARLVGLPVLLAGGLLMATGALALGRQLTPLPAPSVSGRLVVDGPYRYVRHPIYSGVVLGALGLALLTAHPLRLALMPLIIAFFNAKALREERWLNQRYPEAYPAYCRRVPRLIPRLG